MSPDHSQPESEDAVAKQAAAAATPDALPPTDALAAVDDIVGYIDGIAARRFSGWAVNRSRLDERLTVRVFLDDELIGEGIADRPRPDLERNGLGDGAYGFDIEPVRPLSHLDRIRVSAVAVQAGTDDADAVPLDNLIARKLATQSQTEGLAAVTTQLQQVLDENRALQRRTDHALRLIAAELKDMRQRVESVPPPPSEPGPDDAIPTAVTAMREAQAELARQLAEVGVIQARIDSSLATLQADASAPRGGGDDRSLRRLVTILTGVSGIALGLGVLSLFA